MVSVVLAGCDTRYGSPAGDGASVAGSLSGKASDTGRNRPAVPNTIDTVIDDMRLKNDLPLVGIPSHYGWANGPGQVVMGNDPRGSAAPSYWQPADPRFRSGQYWKVLLPWFVIFDGEGHAARNTRVQVRDMSVWIQSRSSGQWRELGASARVEGFNYRKHLHGAKAAKPDFRREEGGSASIKPPLGDHVFHGWCCGRMRIDGPDIAAVWVTLQARLVVDKPSGIDDRAEAKLLIQVGADYYPEQGTSVDEFKPDEYNPGIGLSRSKLVTADWQWFNFATLDVGEQIGKGKSISVERFRAAPPPLH